MVIDLVADTHAILWYLYDDRRLSAVALRQMEMKHGKKADSSDLRGSRQYSSGILESRVLGVLLRFALSGKVKHVLPTNTRVRINPRCPRLVPRCQVRHLRALGALLGAGLGAIGRRSGPCHRERRLVHVVPRQSVRRVVPEFAAHRRQPDTAVSRETYGEDFSYFDFAAMFNEAAKSWKPDSWADLFKRAGARYVVPTTKHHDGFLLWPSRHPNPFIENYHAERDLIGELGDAVRDAGMTYALYYSGGLDWTFYDKVIVDIADLPAGVPQMSDYVDYANAHWRELIERYGTKILWNDIAYPRETDLNVLFADYYNQSARWPGQQPFHPDLQRWRRATSSATTTTILRRLSTRRSARSARKSGSPAAASALPSATTASKAWSSISRSNRWCVRWSTSSARTATCCSTSAPWPTARSRPCRWSGWRGLAAGSMSTARPSMARVPGPWPNRAPTAGSTYASPRRTAVSTPRCWTRRTLSSLRLAG